jgi:glycosyltransferase involved in cell wall biosynthesis
VNIVYISGMCSEKKFDCLFRAGIIKKLPQAQKYHRLLIEGIRVNTQERVLAISSYPINRRWTKKTTFRVEKEKVNEIEYIYPFFLNLPIVRQVCLTLSSFTYTFIFLLKNKNSVAICDILAKSNAAGARFACKLFGRKCIGIVTDVTGRTSGARRKTLPKYQQWILSLLEKITSGNLDNYDAYLFLTEAMNEVINPSNKPYIVLEGHSDVKMNKIKNKIKLKNKKKTILYSGGIHKEFGIKMMTEAFISLNNEEWVLHIYGDGNYKDELESICLKNKNIKYFGVVDNETIVKEQIKAHVLINPRLTDADYIKFSFPSKNMEYMASGTSMLTTVLSGMPIEYYDYVYLINDESIDGFKKSMKKVMEIPNDILHKNGQAAKNFVMNNKNNVVQAKKMIEFLVKL